MSRWKVMCLALIFGVGIGIITPVGVSQLYDIGRTLNIAKTEPALAGNPVTSSPKISYHFEIKQGILSVVQGEPGSHGKVIASGYNVTSWPKGILDMAVKTKFDSLDEVQSFFDTLSEP